VLDLEELLPDVAAARRRIQPEGVERGIPLHVTVLFPFAPAADVAAHLPELARLLEGLAPVTVELERVAVWPGVVYAEPAAAPGLLALLQAVIDAFPAFPPYGGDHPDPRPHATLAIVEPGEEAAIAARAAVELEGALPARASVDVVTVMRETQPDRWERLERVALGGAA
jgi:2'-5' RNA ligase